MSSISKERWGSINGAEVYLFKMINPSGAYVTLSNYGAILVGVYVPDKTGKLGNVVLGFSDLQGYINDRCYIGATIGRFANRIADAKFSLNDTVYHLDHNDGKHSNHSGNSGFNTRVFDVDIDHDAISFSLFSQDSDGGFPGNLQLKVSYRWTDNNELFIHYWAKSDKDTIANFTNHTYFNLSATDKIFNHELMVNADYLVEADSDYIPTGNILPVAELAFKKNSIIEKMNHQEDGTLTGLNTCYILNKCDWTKIPAALLASETTGRVIEVYTSYPGLLLYTGDFLRSVDKGTSGKVYEPFDGLCLECQYYPDSPNHSLFPSTVLTQGSIYEHTIQFRFSTRG